MQVFELLFWYISLSYQCCVSLSCYFAVSVCRVSWSSRPFSLPVLKLSYFNHAEDLGGGHGLKGETLA